VSAAIVGRAFTLRTLRMTILVERLTDHQRPESLTTRVVIKHVIDYILWGWKADIVKSVTTRWHAFRAVWPREEAYSDVALEKYIDIDTCSPRTSYELISIKKLFLECTGLPWIRRAMDLEYGHPCKLTPGWVYDWLVQNRNEYNTRGCSSEDREHLENSMSISAAESAVTEAVQANLEEDIGDIDMPQFLRIFIKIGSFHRLLDINDVPCAMAFVRGGMGRCRREKSIPQ